ncbi:Gfo/Idh/MocA family protein [Bacillus sp. REN16]|uniref:Gfo/Idh/MocA family protein n=1 Tax=Bacillus sp. REN16 TaxID=2887296 RepID=UPI001E5E1892|nr:Gfo/Idh/MocA family oxidoreductase [Bacillus sp. REN16]MCC3357720.1 Gfo/Idh/MocA family oxidoreductase [Bacillus sp. REN16]
MRNIGLVGLGFMGKTHLEAYRHLKNCRVTVICSRNEVKDKDLIQNYNGSFVSDYEELVWNKEIDIIDICVPTFLHEEYIIKAARAGKHVICEKPLSLTMESANRIMNEVNKNDVKLFVGHVLRFWPAYKAIKSLSQTDKLKDIQIIHAKRLGQVPKWSDWFLYPEKSGGALFDLHIHDIDFVYYLLGAVESVYAVGTKNKYGAWDHIMTTLTFMNKSKAFVEASQRMPTGYPFTMSLRAQAIQGTLEFSLIAGENIEDIEDDANQFIYYHSEESSVLPVERGDAFQNELSYFVNCIDKDEENITVPLQDVLYTLKLLQAIEESLETGKQVSV